MVCAPLVVLLAAAPPGAASAPPPIPDLTPQCAAVAPANWSAAPRVVGNDWWDFGLNPTPADVMNEVSLFQLGETYMQSADVGEVLHTVTRINGSEAWSAACEWWRTAARLHAVAHAAERGAHAISAGSAYLRAASYYRAALSRHPDHRHATVRSLSAAEVACFERFLTLHRHACRPVRTAYENTTLPGFWCPAGGDPANKAPTLLWGPGRDTWAEDGLFFAEQGMKRGYNVLLYEGPGNGKVLRLQGLPFRPEWEKVVGPWVDFVSGLSGVDTARLGLGGWSFGGWLATRTAAFERRLKVVVPNPGVLDWYNVTIREFPVPPAQMAWLDGSDADRRRFDDFVWAMVKGNPFYTWGVQDAMWKWGQATPSGWLLDARRYSMVPRAGCEACDYVPLITPQMIVVDAEEDHRGDAVELRRLLEDGGRRPDYLLFTADETAQFHDQPGALAICGERIFDRIDNFL